MIEKPGNAVLTSAPGRTRTCSLLIRSFQAIQLKRKQGKAFRGF